MIIRDEEEARDIGRIDHYVRDFIKRYEPEDRRDWLDFERDLIHLVMLIYREAAKPFQDALTGTALRSPLPPPVVVKEAKKP